MKCALSPVVALTLAAAAQAQQSPEPPSYTNVDLERVAPLRHQTGVASTSKVRPSEAPPRPSRAREREYWRREAERLRRRNERLLDEILDIEGRIEDLREDPRVRPYSDPRIERWRDRIATLRRRVQEREDRLEERARRARVPPGWLR